MSLDNREIAYKHSNEPWVGDLSEKGKLEHLCAQTMENHTKPSLLKSRQLVKGLVILGIGVMATILLIAVNVKSATIQDERRPFRARAMDSAATGTPTPDTPTTGSVSINAVGPEEERSDEKADTTKECSATNVCMKPACVKAAAHMLDSMDQNVDPCEDFYEFACGGWRKSRVLPADYGQYASYSELRDDVNIKLKGLLEDRKGDDIEAVRTAKNMYFSCINEGKDKGVLEEHKNVDIEAICTSKNMYLSCINEERIESKNTSGLYDLLDKFGGWPLLGNAEGGGWKKDRYDLVDLVVSIQKYNNVPLINVWVGMDDKDNSKNVMFIDQVRLGMGAIDFYVAEKHAAKKAAYKELIRNSATMLGSDVPDLEAQVNDIVEFETKLAEIISPAKERRDFTTMYQPMTIADLQKVYTNKDIFTNIEFDWLHFLRELLDLTGENVSITEDEIVVLQGRPYYEKLFPLLNSIQPKTIANYLIWRIVKNRLSNLPIRFRDEVQKFNKVMYGSASSSPRWKKCARYMKSAFDMVLGRLFVEAYFSRESKSEVLSMINIIRDAFKDIIDELDWMDAEMKLVAKEKVDYMVEVIGYPEAVFDDEAMNKKYSELNIDPENYFENILEILRRDGKKGLTDLRVANEVKERRKWLTSPTVVNAFYQQQRNMITFPAGILQPSYFHFDHPRYLNYGGIGFMIGHEITHGFDDVGRQYDKVGNLNDWWKPTAAKLYKEKGECLINQYGNFTDPVGEIKLSARQNQGENIADNGGVKQTYRGYRTFVERNGGKEEELLPGLNLTQNQLFFLNFAQIRCAISSKAGSVAHILDGYHSPNRFRVIGSLQNMPEFSQAFQCPIGSYMNPARKCAVW